MRSCRATISQRDASAQLDRTNLNLHQLGELALGLLVLRDCDGELVLVCLHHYYGAEKDPAWRAAHPYGRFADRMTDTNQPKEESQQE
jgi:hypothetical protein